MAIKKIQIVVQLCLLACTINAQLAVNGFYPWITGRDSATIQYIPSMGYDALTTEENKVVAHVKFKVSNYGEVSFPIRPVPVGIEGPSANLAKSKWIKIRYRSNVSVILQLRQTGVHGGVHNHVILPASSSFATQLIYFSSFKGGLKPLDLLNVAKFNFALLNNNSSDGFAELTIRAVKIDHYKPKKSN